MYDDVFQDKLNYHLLDSFVKQTSIVISGHFPRRFDKYRTILAANQSHFPFCLGHMYCFLSGCPGG